MNKNKRYSILLLSLTLVLLFLFGGTVIFIDPFFHFHQPNENFSYGIYEERYQNDGILRNFKYDAMITGTSMTENFKTSECNSLFEVTAVKTPFSGGRYKEIDGNVQRAISYNPNISLVIRAIDYNYLFTNKDESAHEEASYPTYLSNDTIFDDVKYIFNKTIFFENVMPVLHTFSLHKGDVVSFDEAYNWNDGFVFGKDAIFKEFERVQPCEKEELTQEMIDEFQANIDQNMVATVKANPNIEFYYFLTPYSILYWDGIQRTNQMDKHIQAERMIIESLIPYENMHLFSFSNAFELTTDLDNYKDPTHYSEEINSWMLENMAKDSYRLTSENYEEYLQMIESFYRQYPYEDLFK